MRFSPASGALRPAAFLLLAATAPATAAGQTHAHDEPAPAAAMFHVGGSATGLVTRAAPALAGETYVEGYLTQPVLWAGARLPGGRLSAMGMLNLEGLTLDRGELTAGIWGEGYIDRRHPHTYLHELAVSAHGSVAGGAATLTAGRGFAPFGTDDPMVRPFVKFPLNHHLAQIPERLVGIAAFRRGPAAVEAGLFTGAEPVGAADLGSIEGFGASWAVRLTLFPGSGLELQGSTARVAGNPALEGAGLDHAKFSLSARAEGAAAGGHAYGMLEWARTDEEEAGRRVYTFESVLGEAALHRGSWGGGVRVERSTRPEPDRLADPFRSTHPHDDTHLAGITRWLVLAARAEHRARFGAVRAAPFVEGSWQRVEEVTGGIFDPVEQYGDDRQWHLSLGLTVGAGAEHMRMGRYGAALPGGH